jgi:hypothetical protein
MYDAITQKAGYEGRLKFAEKVGVSKNKAPELEDTLELIEKWKIVAKSIIGEDIGPYIK